MECKCGDEMKKISLDHVSCGIEFWNYICENCGHSQVTGKIVMKFADDYLDDLLADYEED